MHVRIRNPGPETRATIRLRWAYSSIGQGMGKVRFDTLNGAAGPVYEIPVQLPARSKRVYTAYVLARENASLWVVLDTERGDPGRPYEIVGREVKPYQGLIVVVGTRIPPTLRRALGKGVEIGCVQPENLPDRWLGFSGIDGLLWLDGDPSRIRDPEQGEALKQWVSNGGTLLVARAHAAGLAGTFLEPMLPVSLRNPVQLGNEEVLPGLSKCPFPPGKVMVLASEPRPEARIRSKAGDIPILAEWNFGRGWIRFLACDPTQEPLSTWDGIGDVWRDHLPRPLGDFDLFEANWPGENAEQLAAGSRLLHSLAFEYPSVKPPSLGWVFLLLLVYVLLVGPVDYFVLRWRKKQEWTWITFPGCVLLFCLITLGAAGLSGTKTTAGLEMTVVDCMPDVGQTRIVSVCSLLTPRRMEVDLFHPRPGGVVEPLDQGSWMPLEAELGETAVSGVRVEQSERIGVRGWRIKRGQTAVWLQERCHREGGRLSFEAEVSRDGTARLDVQNDLGSPLRDALLVTNRGVYKVPKIPAGRSEFRDLRPDGIFAEALRRAAGGGDLGAFIVNPDRYGGRWPFVGVCGTVGGSRARKEEDLRRNVYRLLVGLSFARKIGKLGENALLTGTAASLEASDWVDGGGMVLLGRLVARGGLGGLERYVDRVTSEVLVRAFVR